MNSYFIIIIIGIELIDGDDDLSNASLIIAHDQRSMLDGDSVAPSINSLPQSQAHYPSLSHTIIAHHHHHHLIFVEGLREMELTCFYVSLIVIYD